MKARLFYVGILYLVLNCFAIICRGQQQDVLPLAQSPNAAGLSSFEQMGVSPFTGLANISIPVFSLKQGDITVNAHLDYYSGGVKASGHPGWVGQNWTLNVGGIVTRKVNGGVDEVANTFSTPATPAAYNEYSLFYNSGELNNASWATTNFITSYWSSANAVYNGGSGTQGIVNPAPDEFDFTLPTGVTGSFYLNHLNQWVVKTKAAENLQVIVAAPQAVTIGYDNSTGDDGTITLARTIAMITIIDSKGNQYVFGSTTTDRPIEFTRGPTCGCTTNYNTQNIEIIATAWYLTKIISPSGNVVTFTYTRPENQYIVGTKYPDYFYTQFNVGPANAGGWYSFSQNGETYTGEIVTPSYLSSIFANSFTANFSIAPTTEQAYVYSKAVWSNLPTSAPFNYGDLPISEGPMSPGYSVWYQLNSITINDLNGVTREKDNFFYTSSTSQRLFLNELDRVNLTGGGDMPYYFTYNSTPLPAYNALQQDQWGYYNGITFPGTVAQGATAASIMPYLAMNTTNAQAGILQTITYPTGGTTTINYQANDYSYVLQTASGAVSLLSQTGIGGGLRVGSITNTDNNGNSLTKSYVYQKVSTGASSGILNGYNKILYNITLGTTSPGGPAVATATTLVYDDFLSRTNYTDGRDVVYSEVKETLPDGSYNIYDYSNSDNANYLDEPPIVVYSNAFTYSNYNGLYDGAYTTTTYSSGTNPFMSHSSRELERGQLLTLTNKNPGGVTVKVVQNTYNSDPTRFNNYVRTFDNYSNVGSAGSTLACEQYFQAIKIYTYFPYLQTTATTVYDQNGNNAITTTLNYTYDNLRNLTNITTLSSEGETVSTTLNYANTPVGGLSGTAATAQTAMAGNTVNMVGIPLEKIVTRNGAQTDHSRTDFQVISNPILGTNNILPAAQWQAYSTNALEQRSIYTKYDNYGNILEQQKVSDLPYAYLYDYKHSYKVADVMNANQVNVAYTSFEADGTGNWLYTGTATADLTSPTGVNCYNLAQSNGAITISGLTSTLTYTVTYWVKSSAAALTIAGTIAGYPIKGKTSAIGGWTCYTHNITGQTSLTISGSVYIDELRLFPQNALMTTYTYQPLTGMSSKTDPNNRITYYRYDGLLRLAAIADQDLNVIKVISYAYQNEVFHNTVVVAAATRNNCPLYDQGTAATLTVNAGTYSSPVSVTAATALAQNYANANAQANANTNGTCNIGVSESNTLAKTFTVTATNTAVGGKTYTFSPTANSSSSVIGYIPPGTYNVKACAPSGYTTQYVFQFGAFLIQGANCLSGTNLKVAAYGDAAIYINAVGGAQ